MYMCVSVISEHVCVCVFACVLVLVKARPLLFLCLACLYDGALYWYMYTRLQDGAQRANVLGSCSSLLTSLIVMLPALEVVSTR